MSVLTELYHLVLKLIWGRTDGSIGFWPVIPLVLLLLAYARWKEQRHDDTL